MLLDGCLRQARAWLPWLSTAEVVRMATQTPADALGLPRKGRVAPAPMPTWSCWTSFRFEPWSLASRAACHREEERRIPHQLITGSSQAQDDEEVRP